MSPVNRLLFISLGCIAAASFTCGYVAVESDLDVTSKPTLLLICAVLIAYITAIMLLRASASPPDTMVGLIRELYQTIARRHAADEQWLLACANDSTTVNLLVSMKDGIATIDYIAPTAGGARRYCITADDEITRHVLSGQDELHSWREPLLIQRELELLLSNLRSSSPRREMTRV
jgi:hypothetical protein